MKLCRDRCDEIFAPEHLSDTALAIIALAHMGIDSLSETAKLLGVREPGRKRTLAGLVTKIKKSKNPTLRSCMDYKLPPGTCVPLPGAGAKIQCPLCRQWVNKVPCLACSIRANKRVKQ